MTNLFTEQLGDHISGIYSCFDRVLVSGYCHKLFSAGGLINFLKSCRFEKHTDGVMRLFTDQLNSHIKKIAKKEGGDIIWGPALEGGKNGDKLKYVSSRYLRKDKRKENFIYGIIADMERVRSFTTRTLMKKDGGSFDKIQECKKLVKHYYIYFQDQLLGGPCYLKICTYFPFNVEFYFNGHNALKQELDWRKIGQRMQDNAFTWIENYNIVQKMAFSLSGNLVQERIDYWMNLCFRFDKGKYSTRPEGLHHDWYLSEVEVWSNIIFKSARFGKGVFERILDKYSRLGSPESLFQVFDKRKKRGKAKTTVKLFDNKACFKSWLYKNSLKCYNKLWDLIRLENTINNPKALGLNKGLAYLLSYLKTGIENNSRLMSRFADRDIASISDEETEVFNHSYVCENQAKVAAVDLRKDRQAALLKTLLNPKYFALGFKTMDMLKELTEFYQNSGQIRYEMEKLLVRGLLVKLQGKNKYRVTEKGYKIMWVKLCSNSYFSDPLITKIYRNNITSILSQPSKLEEAYYHISQGLELIIKELRLKNAA